MLMIATEDAIVLNVIIALMDAVDAHTFFKHCIHNKFTLATYIVTFFSIIVCLSQFKQLHVFERTKIINKMLASESGIPGR